MKALTEILETPCKGSFDVIVCGGGVAGCAAAVAAAREGASVLLLEKSILLGGLATNGLISWYEPICDGRGNKLMGGMAEELLGLSIRDGNDTLPPQWKGLPESADTQRRCACYFSPTLFSMALDGWLAEAGVTILLDTVIVRPVAEGTRCTGLVVENKGGRFWYGAKTVVDATGDLDILARAGADTELGSNYLSYIGYVVDGDTLAEASATGNLLHSRRWTSNGSDLWGRGHPQDFPRLSGVTAEEVTAFVLEGRKLFYQKLCQSDRQSRDVSILPSMAQFRTTRRLVGEYTLTEEDRGCFFGDSVGAVCDFSKPGHLYEIPYRTLYTQKLSNVWTAGRTISSTGWAWEVTRVIPVAVLTGQAAGIAAAMCVQSGLIAAEVPLDQLQTKLSRSGVRIHI